jgi:single-strand DNA-binding protein
MPSLNRVFLIGHLTREPELRYTPEGTPLAEIALAISRAWRDEGQKREEVTYVDVVLWGRLSEVAQRYLTKGRPVFIEGRLELDIWERDGQKHSRLRVVGENMQLLGSKGDTAAATRESEVHQF